MPPPTSEDPWTRWAALSDTEIRVGHVNDILASVKDDQWVVAACTDRLLDHTDTQRSLLDLGILRTQPATERSQLIYNGDDTDATTASKEEVLAQYWRVQVSDAQICRMRSVLLHRLDRLNTFVEMCKEFKPPEKEEKEEVLGDEEWEDDPWGDEVEGDAHKTVSATQTPSSTAEADTNSSTPVALSVFLYEDLAYLASLLASREEFSALKVLFNRHGDVLWPYRLSILESIPEYSQPAEYHDLLPGYDHNTGYEKRSQPHPWRSVHDWTETPVVILLLQRELTDSTVSTPHFPQNTEPLSSNQLIEWYTTVVDRIIGATGMVDIALELVQHGSSQGVPSLDEIGEDLSLISRLVYDAPQGPLDAVDEWTLKRWRGLTPLEVTQAYLAYSTPSSVASDIRTFVQPYLFVLESRAERAGKPDPELPTRILYQYVLSAPLELVAVIFDSSKPIWPVSQRLIRSDEDLARLALACLYSSPSLDAWPTMSRIFECMPAWKFAEDASADEDEREAMETTATSLGAFVTPTVQRPHVAAEELLLFFQPLDARALSRALDILDVNLESGEIFARWGVPAPLKWFLQSRSDEHEQRKWAVRMSRKAGNLGERVDTEDEWELLLDDMLKLAGTSESGLKGAFGHISRDEVIRIFFSGVITAGDFKIARTLLRRAKSKLALSQEAIEDICLGCSREFYDNASSGNYRSGDMKLAYDCLDIPPSSERIAKEKEFIEATSRISSFNVMSRAGMPISPIEIRLTKDRLTLVSSVLSSTPDAYKHAQVILELAHKLGYRNDPVAETKVLAMIADTALQAEDFATAFDTSERMVSSVLELREKALGGADDPQVQEASEVCWIACFQLGRQPEFEDVQKKMSLIGRALELCPPDKLPDILMAWRRLETEFLEEHKELHTEPRGRRRAARRAGDTPSLLSPLSAGVASATSNLASRLQMSVPSTPLLHAPDAAALASRALGRVAGFTGFGRSQRDGSVDSQRSGKSDRGASISRPGSAVPVQASSALQKGIGWLIGADGQ